ncbi:acyl-CoA carboxylase epsilon subunit [Streptomyces sp. LBL]|uniref:acyl-CoA carboxylase epsilon subunit n=1 Tax=Streptomyces sp. LBL TaxID=2940562 RepID=UPI002476BDE8|nr:acyl-CoA carboxylase epsilon subunit [Streptomyces sp. LBL]
MSSRSEAETLVLRVLRGTPTPEELAAATAALLGAVRQQDASDDPADTVRHTADWGRTGPAAHRSATSWRH